MGTYILNKNAVTVRDADIISTQYYVQRTSMMFASRCGRHKGID